MERRLPCDGVMPSLKTNGALGEQGDTERLLVLTEWSSSPLGPSPLPAIPWARGVDIRTWADLSNPLSLILEAPLLSPR